MKKHKKKFPIGKMTKVLKVSCAGYYKHANKKMSSLEKENKELEKSIKEIYEQSREIYGSPRIHASLKRLGHRCSRKRVARIIKENGIKSKIRKRWKTTRKTINDLSRIKPNLINQNFFIDKKDTIWVSDITYVKTKSGWLYVSAILDLYSRKIIGLSMDSHMNTSLIKRSLDQAICHRDPKKGLVLHSDRGSQYTSFEYKKHALKHGVVLSMSAAGNCYDNAAMESFFHTLKTEHVFLKKFETRKEAAKSIFEYVEVFYNRQRLHSTLNYLSPLEFEQLGEAKQQKQMESRMKIALPAKEVNLPICYV